MNFDDKLKAAFYSEQPRLRSADDLQKRVLAQLWRRRLQRAAEVALSLGALVVFGSALDAEKITIETWVILPFFVVFLPVVWTLILREPPRRSVSPAESSDTYARQRLMQLRSSLREIWIARHAANALLVYSLGAALLLTIWTVPNAGHTAITISAYALVWFAGTRVITRWGRKRMYCEYRGLYRVVRSNERA